MAFLDPILNPVLQPLINLGPFWAIVVLSLLISLVIVLVYKYFTNQNEMKRLKDEQKEFQKKMKELRNQPEEMMKVQKEAMSANLQYMKHSFKATLITMLPIILIFSWMNAHLMYEPIFPDETYSVSAQFAEGVTGEAELIVDERTELLSDAAQPISDRVTWRLKSDEGEHFLTVKTNHTEQSKKVLITKEVQYEEPITRYDHSDIALIQINYDKLQPLGELSLFGWHPGWLGLYIIISILASLLLRKVMNVY
ncbi:MAG TPA: EMC3/TMCO1 family protein [Candidatus Nanoarchaeia archaeon]|nr:EMC3/TMCO1 family protein [Candidatus Nanoarchaeia archaeon]